MREGLLPPRFRFVEAVHPVWRKLSLSASVNVFDERWPFVIKPLTRLRVYWDILLAACTLISLAEVCCIKIMCMLCEGRVAARRLLVRAV